MRLCQEAQQLADLDWFRQRFLGRRSTVAIDIPRPAQFSPLPQPQIRNSNGLKGLRRKKSLKKNVNGGKGQDNGVSLPGDTYDPTSDLMCQHL